MIAVPSQSYEIAQTEVTYELWSAVLTWALANGYTFANAATTGTKGSSGSGSDQQPVTTIRWYDAIVWCNALTEYYAAKGGTSYKCVYYTDPDYITPIHSTSNIGTLYIYGAATGNTDMAKYTAKGFRLPTSNEWNQAAQYIDGTNYYPGYFTSGADAGFDVTSGASDYDGDGDVDYTDNVAVYKSNSGATAKVMSKNPNKLGLYDMSGNVWEWCFDTHGSWKFTRGGGWQSNAEDLQIVTNYFVYPDMSDVDIGLRPVRTQ
ncbi:MAG TPA: hypothetical protein DDW65_03815 [Firmicutes bacterium]|jgi:formylglycine-generating enzyme|nr:hypothetical protein [Bacillota bacterium]